MYKVVHWMKSLIGDIIEDDKYCRVEHYFTDSKKAIEYYFEERKVHKNCVLVVTTKHSEFVFMFHYSDNFPKELRPHTFTQIFTEIDSTDKTISMYEVFENACGFKRPVFRFNQDGSVEEI